MKSIKNMVAVAAVAVACGLGGMGTASACGPYGDPGVMMQAELGWAQQELEAALSSFDEAARQGDAEALGKATARVMTASKVRAGVAKRLETYRRAQENARAAKTASR